MTRGLLVLSASLSLIACNRDRAPGGGDGHAGALTEPAAPDLSATAPAGRPAAVEVELSGPHFAGTLRLAESQSAPLVVFLPKTYGTRQELLPFVTRALEQGLAAHTLVLDPPQIELGPAADVSAPPRKPGAVRAPSSPAKLSKEAVDALVAGAREAIAAADARLRESPPVLLVGSDFGATLAVLVAQVEPRVRAAALVSPGAALHGVPVYRPFAGLVGKPVFLAGGASDTVATEPLEALAAMGRDQVTKKVYPGVGHGAGALLATSPIIADDLSEWLRATTAALAASAPPASPPAASVPSASVPSVSAPVPLPGLPSARKPLDK